MRKLMGVLTPAALAVALANTVARAADPGFPLGGQMLVVTLDENCNGTASVNGGPVNPLPCAPDPGSVPPNAPTFILPISVTPGDVKVLERATPRPMLSDVLRFPEVAPGVSDRVAFFSETEPASEAELSDVGNVKVFQANTVSILEGTFFQGTVYNPAGPGGPATYNVGSDARLPGPGDCFNGGDPSNNCSGGCSSGGPECASDDTGCVPDTGDHRKCSAAIVKAFIKAIAAVGKCHCKQATNLLRGKPYDEESCEGHALNGRGAEDKLDAAITKVAPLCSGTQLAFAAAEESALFAGKNVAPSFDAQNGAVFCDSTSGAMIMNSDSDDAGWVPTDRLMLKCECAVDKNLGKLAGGALKCHIKMANAFFFGKQLDETRCEEFGPRSPLGKYNVIETELLLKAICPPCLDQAHQDALGAGVLAQVEATNVLGYPCP